jgi:Glycosyl transferase family 2
MPLRDEGFGRSAAPAGGVRVVVLAGRSHPAAALRAGLAAATGGCLVLLDGAMSIEPAQLERFAAALDAGAAVAASPGVSAAAAA